MTRWKAGILGVLIMAAVVSYILGFRTGFLMFLLLGGVFEISFYMGIVRVIQNDRRESAAPDADAHPIEE